MARFCSKCNKKFGFFEEDYDGMCKSCYDKSVEEERIRLQKEKEEERKRQEKEEQERIKRQEEERKKREKEEQEIIKKQEEKRKEEEKIRKLEEERIKKEEEEKRLKEEKEKKIQEEKLKIANEKKLKSFNKNFLNSELAIKLYSNSKMRDYTFIDLKLKEKYKNINGYDIINYILKMIIQELDEEFLLDNIIEEFKKPQNLINVLQEFIDIDSLVPTKHYETSEKLLTDKEVIDDIKDKMIIYLRKDVADAYIIKIFNLNYNTTLLDIDDTVANDYIECIEIVRKDEFKSYNDYNERQFDKCVYILVIYYFYAFLIVFYSKLESYYDNFKENEELFSIYTNLKKEIKNDLQYINSKIYSIYKGCYKNLFPEQISEFEMLMIIQVAFIEENMREIIYTAFDFEKFEKEIIKNEEQKNKKIFDIISEEISNNELMRECFNNQDENTANYLKTLVRKFMLKYSDIDKTFYILSNFFELYTDIEDKISMYQASLDRERYLRGDFSKEKEMQKQEIEYSNVQNGYEFEQYVANLYKKLGYTIEEVTKKSGDQRCRCNSK